MISTEVLSDEDLKEMTMDVYNVLDKVGDNCIDSHQVIDGLRITGLNPLTDDVEGLLKQNELDKKRIDHETFMEIYRLVVEIASQDKISLEDVIECVGSTDKNSTGFVKAGQLHMQLVHMGDILTDAQADYMTAKYADNEGLIDYRKMVKNLIEHDGKEQKKKD